MSDHVPGTSGPADVERMKANEVHFKSPSDLSNKPAFLVRGGGDAVHRPECSVARRKGMVRWLWAEHEGTEFWWDDGHPVRRNGALTHRVMWLHACQRCRPDLVGTDESQLRRNPDGR